MAELADAADSKSAGLRPLGVRLPLPAPMLPICRGRDPSTHLRQASGSLRISARGSRSRSRRENASSSTHPPGTNRMPLTPRLNISVPAKNRQNTLNYGVKRSEEHTSEL